VVAPPNPEAVVKASLTSPIAGLRLLLVEDDVSTRMAMKWLLEQKGAVITAADSTDKALSLFQRGPPFDLLIADIGLPGRDGYELLRKIREIEQVRGEQATLPAVAVTAHAYPDDRERVLAAGYQHHLPKPVEPAELMKVIAIMTGRGSMEP
jgi:CheY-like chemotaxis protein